MPARTHTFTLASALSETPLLACISALDVGRAIFLYIGLGEAPASLGSLYAASPGAPAAAPTAAAPTPASDAAGGGAAPSAPPPARRPLPASSTQLLDGCSPAVDETEADFFSAQLSARTGKLVLLSMNISSDLVDGLGLLEIKRRALEFADGLRAGAGGAGGAGSQ